MRVVLPLLFAFGCPADQNAPPEQLAGRWEVYQLELASGVVDAQDAVRAAYPDCVWGRQIWEFEAPSGTAEAKTSGYLSATTDVLCPVRKVEQETEYYGCTVTTRVPATWDATSGRWKVADGAVSRSRTLPMDTAAIPGPTVCEARIDAGEYLAVKVRGEKWKWEMRTPDGAVTRLRQPDTERPDFVAALINSGPRARQGAAPAGAAAPGAP